MIEDMARVPISEAELASDLYAVPKTMRPRHTARFILRQDDLPSA